MRCGLLQYKIDILRPYIQENEFGERVEEYKPYYCTRARMISNGGGKQILNQEITYLYRKVFEVHHYVDVRETDLIQYNDKRYRIISIDLDRTQMKKVITCEEADE